MVPEITPAPLSCSRRQRSRAATTITPLGTPAVSLRHSPVGDGGIATASGPLRHPKPLTPSDIHSLYEMENEAIVNRLSRELTMLRQQTASVASTTSSTSTNHNDSVDAHHSPYIGNYASSGRHRSSSSLSSSYVPAVQESRAGRDGLQFARPVWSRQQSVNSFQQSEMASPTLSSSLQQNDHFPSRSPLSQSQQGTTPTSPLSRFEEVAQHRAEYEAVRRENDSLRKRVQELEAVLRRPQGESTEKTVLGLAEELNKMSVAQDK